MESNHNSTTASEQRNNTERDDSSCSDEGIDNQSAQSYFDRVTPPQSLLSTDRLKSACVLDETILGNHVGSKNAVLKSDSVNDFIDDLEQKDMDMTTLSNR